ncbi:MAG: energy transducer TonB [Acidobacteriota bacterium]
MSFAARVRGEVFLRRLLVAALVVLASPAAAQDFYEGRLRSGEAALADGRAVDAAEDLRIAAFGLLDKPALLCQALANLAVAQSSSGHPAETKATLQRFAEVQRRFPACREAHLDDSRRTELNALARKMLPPATAEQLLAPTSPTPLPKSPPSPLPTAVPAVPPAAPAQVATRIPTPTPAASAPSVPRSSAQPPAQAPVPADDLDREPQLKTTTRPVYPESAQRAGIGGIVLLRVLVSASGVPLQVEIARGVQPDLDQAALAAVRQWVFEPGRRKGAAVAAWMTVAVPFEAPRR